MKTTKHTSDYKEAKKEFFAVCQQYENTTFDRGFITLMDETGKIYKIENLEEIM